MGRNDEIWPNASEYTPSRWIDGENKLTKETQWKADRKAHV